MNTFFLALALAVPTVAPSAGAQPAELAWRPFPDALRAAQAEARPALVYVGAPWCGPCRELERGALADAGVRARLEHFALARLTIDDRDEAHRVGPYRLSEAGWAARLGAETTPTLVLLAPDGGVLARHAGLIPPSALRSLLDAALADVRATR